MIEKYTYCVNSMKKKKVQARCGCGPLAPVQGAPQCGLRLVRQGSLIPLYTLFSPAFTWQILSLTVVFFDFLSLHALRFLKEHITHYI